MQHLIKQETKALSYFHEAQDRLGALVTTIEKEIKTHGDDMKMKSEMIASLQEQLTEHQDSIAALNGYKAGVVSKRAKISEFTFSEIPTPPAKKGFFSHA